MRTVKATQFPDGHELLSSDQLGAAIRAMLTKSGITLEDAAMTLNMAKQTLSDVELGKSSVSLGNALKAAHGLGVSLFVFRSEKRELIKIKLEETVC